VDDWLNQDHLARFIVEVIDQLDLSKLTRQYAGRGSKAYHPATLLAILVYGYATGVFSSRRLEQATYDSVAFRFHCRQPASGSRQPGGLPPTFP
jgi:transposase